VFSNRLFDIFAWFGLTVRHAVQELGSLTHKGVKSRHSDKFTVIANPRFSIHEQPAECFSVIVVRDAAKIAVRNLQLVYSIVACVSQALRAPWSVVSDG